MSSASIPYSSGGGGVIVALSGNAGVQALPFVLSPGSIGSSTKFFADTNIQRTLTPCTDQWSVPSAGLGFTHYHASVVHARHQHRHARRQETVLSARDLDDVHRHQYHRGGRGFLFRPAGKRHAAKFLPVARIRDLPWARRPWRRQPAVCDLLSGSALKTVLNGLSTGFAFHINVPAGQARSLTVAVAYYRGAIVDSRISASYYYTTLFSSMDKVIDAAFAEFPDAQIRCQQLAGAMQNSGINVYRQFLASDALHSYQCNTLCLIDPGNKVYWRESEGAYQNINTFDLTVDHSFYVAVMHPWGLRNMLDAFSGASNGGIGYTFTHPLYDETTGNPVSANGFSFQHDMGGNTSNGQVFKRSHH